MTLKTYALVVGLACCATSAAAQAVFDVKLGPKTLGTLSYAASDGNARMITALNNTPLGVFNGTMDATSKPGNGRQTFKATTGAENKDRMVIVAHKDGRALETTVTPAIQITPLSDPSKVPAGIVDPVQAFGKMLAAADCPDGITIYDGRRAMAVTLVDAAVKDGLQTCRMSYRVVAGPPHLTPLNVAKAKMKLVYTANDTPRRLARIELSHGVFRVKLLRRD